MSKGYSLIELVVVVALTAILALSSATLFYSTLKGGGKASVLAEVKQQGDYAMVVMERVLRNGIKIEECTDTRLRFTDINDAEHIFEMQGTAVLYNTQPIISNSVNVDQLRFQCTSGNSVNSDQVKIDLRIRKGNPTVDRVEDVYAQSFQTTVNLRNY